MRIVPPRALIAALVALLLPFAFAASAHAFSIDRVTPTPAVPAGGSVPNGDPFSAAAHPDMAIRIEFSDNGDSAADSARDLSIHLAPGVVAYVNNFRQCTQAQFAVDDHSRAADCAADTAVGTVVTGLTTTNPLVNGILGGRVDGTIYNLEPSAGSPAAFGIDIAPPVGDHIKLISPISVDPHDLGLTASLAGLPNRATVPIFGEVGLHTDYIIQRLDGYPGGRPFFTNPTSCIDAAITVTATSYGGASSSNAGSYTPTDCANVPFQASLTTAADPATPDSTSAISFDVKPGEGNAERVSSHVRTTTVVAPPGVLLNVALAANLDACTDAGFNQADTSVAANCPASSEVGSIEFVSPILGSFPGKVYFGTQTPTDRLRLFLDVPLFGAHIKVSATVNPDNTTGQVTTVFSDLPQIAFTDFRLTFRGGPRSALVTPTTCGENVSTAIVGPWSGTPRIETRGAFTTAGDCERRFTPSMGTSVANTQGGASSPFTLTFDRPDRTIPVGRVAFDLPPGLIGSLALRGLTKCSLDNARAGNCEDSSRIGSVQSIDGSGPEPPTLPGSIYLTQPQQPGDPAGLTIKVPAHLGPVDAGTVIVNQRLILGNDGGLDIISDPIPALQFGIPLAIRRLIVNVDRPGFMRNPTSCGQLPASGDFTPLDGGANVGATSTLAVTGCDRLPFGPQISGRIGGKGLTKQGAHPAFTTTITQRSGEAAMKQAVVTLPKAVSTNLATIREACDPAVFAARRCSERSRVATAKAVSPLISRPLTGPTYLVRVPTGGLPKLMVQLRGEVNLDLEGIVSIRNNLVVTTFGAIPDLTLSSFELAFRGGSTGVLTTVGNLCAKPPLVSSFVGQNGKRSSRSPRLVPIGCTRPQSTGSLRFRRGRGALSVSTKVPSGSKPLASVAVTLPKGLTTSGASISAKAGGKRAGGRALTRKGRTVTVKLPKKGARAVTVKVTGLGAGRALARRLAARRGRLSVRVTTRQTNKAKASQSVRLTLK
ncbi:hypothetical protein Q5424_02530 [Conexibacter sp. JD483]|uniref:hypothetical protein n=1 Tax=unclassified Conexibacter TaxID=2627773 RepID=UPI002723C4F2|nr:MULTISPECIES: hypothetical protein [unclassified Conexibacter]MDO8184030.1 hypothetical protein [Conexibacter sp. CPCC 205706]MDO8197022.1 hypothetical protein [Conexibacter sp. CPCC 205762]MDR9367938.1 hypothetical protein [Conexibacter sp. JD483]